MSWIWWQHDEAFGARETLWLTEQGQGICQAHYHNEQRHLFLVDKKMADKIDWVVPPLEVSALRELVAAVRLPLEPNFAMGVDGHSTSLEITAGMNSLKLHWWLGLPEEWRDLAPVLKMLHRMVQNEYGRLRGEDV